MKRHLILLGFSLLSILLNPVGALAADSDQVLPDARMVGYPTSVALSSGVSILTWLVLIVLGMITLAPLFTNAKRTHLD